MGQGVCCAERFYSTTSHSEERQRQPALSESALADESNGKNPERFGDTDSAHTLWILRFRWSLRMTRCGGCKENGILHIGNARFTKILSSRPKRSAVEGSAVCLYAKRNRRFLDSLRSLGMTKCLWCVRYRAEGQSVCSAECFYSTTSHSERSEESRRPRLHRHRNLARTVRQGTCIPADRTTPSAARPLSTCDCSHRRKIRKRRE